MHGKKDSTYFLSSSHAPEPAVNKVDSNKTTLVWFDHELKLFAEFFGNGVLITTVIQGEAPPKLLYSHDGFINDRGSYQPFIVFLSHLDVEYNQLQSKAFANRSLP